MAKVSMPRKNRAPKGPLKKKSELERLQEAAGAAAAAAEAAEAAAAGGEVEPMKEAARAAARESAALPKTMSLQLPTRPVEEASEGRDDETPAPAPDGKPALTVNIAKLQAMSMTDLNNMAKEMAIENFGTCASTR